MIREPTPFPFPGAWALLEVDGRTAAVRIQIVHGGEALVSIPSRFKVASGNRRVALADLDDPTPLSAAEREELLTLASNIAGAKRPRSAKARAELAVAVTRRQALRRRELHARLLAEQLERMNPRFVPEARSAVGALRSAPTSGWSQAA